MIKLFEAATRGGKWGLYVEPSNANPECWIYFETKNGRHCGSGGSVNHEYVKRRVAMAIKDSKAIDGHTYIISLDTIGVAEELKFVEAERLYPAARLRLSLQADLINS